MSSTRRRILVIAGAGVMATVATACGNATPASSGTHSSSAAPSPAGGSSPAPVALEPNLDEVVRGNYATLNGTWRTAAGDELTIKHALISWQVDGAPFAETSSLQFTPRGGDTVSSAGAIVLGGVGVLPWFYSDATGKETSSALYVFPTGSALTLPDTAIGISTDVDQPRILALPGNAAAGAMPQDMAPFVAMRVM